jgi:MFS-type transporter involved in bile tolerance (Atg22 family)
MLLSSRAAAIAGPFIWGFTVDALEPARGSALAYRAAVGTVAAMFAVSLVVLRRVPRRDPPSVGGVGVATAR